MTGNQPPGLPERYTPAIMAQHGAEAIFGAGKDGAKFLFRGISRALGFVGDRFGDEAGYAETARVYAQYVDVSADGRQAREKEAAFKRVAGDIGVDEKTLASWEAAHKAKQSRAETKAD